MARNWTPDERRRQAEAVKTWQPWKQSTGPKTGAGRAKAAKNAYKHGFRSADMARLRLALRARERFVRRVLIHALKAR